MKAWNFTEKLQNGTVNKKNYGFALYFSFPQVLLIIQPLEKFLVTNRVRLFAIPWTLVHQAPLSMEFSMPE